MGIGQFILDLNAARPFVPFEIKMVSGEKYHVPHPEFIAVFDRKDVVTVWTPQKQQRILNAFLIEWVGPPPAPNNPEKS